MFILLSVFSFDYLAKIVMIGEPTAGNQHIMHILYTTDDLTFIKISFTLRFLPKFRTFCISPSLQTQVLFSSFTFL